ncbi:hypothetical protein RSA37_01260 [Mammaliicoccus sciuri]|uniref:hypothetical protein n=1 Tax=Mammaliicoccus sciuri TaxID=1296 RepID=UPI000733E81A|nr:hypothetical protein [Mammaliicoccus sciuri]KTT86002.1 hypothetical protein NS1R_04495 [Mammaliicoccus sciuri]KTT90327.1 hypothetical protein NS36R_06040 [Mammaliicoccus sciuri]KTT91067.1 hypothetical protein NS112_01390 [Mammaliicoccus sciuri]KTT93898.1 hypothetical protein NS44R_06875 [Mammaliicoccus sciuri]KTW14110.1 hypothetical protein RSA37_01260 [Mammaliicoccus sciuri]
MTLPIIALIASLIALVINLTFVIINYKHEKASDVYSFDDKPYVTKGELYSLQNNLNLLQNKIISIESKILPLTKSYEEEQQEKLIEIRKAHWKSFNTWKMQKERMNRDARDTPICGACYNNSLELDVEYKTVEGEPYYTSWGDVVHLESKKDYPLSADQKCTICGHVADKWKCKEC